MLYERVRDLPLEIDAYDLEPLEQEVATDFTLRRTEVVLRGRGLEGRGEEVDYNPDAQIQFQARRSELPLVGAHTLDSFSLLQSGQGDYRRWAFESAALDLALKQAGLSLADALGLQVRPVRFVVSMRVANVEPWLELEPDLRFKLDPDREWGDELIDRLAASGRVDTLDFKGVYRGDFGVPPDPPLYEKIAAAFPDAWLEDPALTAATTVALDGAL